MKLVLTLMTIAVACGITLGCIALNAIDQAKNDSNSSCDYHIYLLQNGEVTITSKQGISNTIKLEDIPVYITADNL